MPFAHAGAHHGDQSSSRGSVTRDPSCSRHITPRAFRRQMVYVARNSPMRSLRYLCLVPLAACVEPTTDADLAAMDPSVIAATAAASWESAPTVHEGTHLVDRAAANSRRVHSLWISGSNMNHVPLDVDARATDGDDVRI